eukprot:CAMPEP_0174876352 /NCGR_PEP_ID=MMETSP1114-20130205/80011_1 /TAXON_ID=312471 /ORGANISM="Neobodo designis, Strain CCAP 1951/1" /LENGTH=34 /DNA_ID= /DNA_START= /DNA_END= /DNA_ORIENTATION=
MRPPIGHGGDRGAAERERAHSSGTHPALRQVQQA